MCSPWWNLVVRVRFFSKNALAVTKPWRHFAPSSGTQRQFIGGRDEQIMGKRSDLENLASPKFPFDFFVSSWFSVPGSSSTKYRVFRKVSSVDRNCDSSRLLVIRSSVVGWSWLIKESCPSYKVLDITREHGANTEQWGFLHNWNESSHFVSWKQTFKRNAQKKRWYRNKQKVFISHFSLNWNFANLYICSDRGTILTRDSFKQWWVPACYVTPNPWSNENGYATFDTFLGYVILLRCGQSFITSKVLSTAFGKV